MTAGHRPTGKEICPRVGLDKPIDVAVKVLRRGHGERMRSVAAAADRERYAIAASDYAVTHLPPYCSSDRAGRNPPKAGIAQR